MSDDDDRLELDSNRSTVIHSGKLPPRLNMELLRSLQEEEATTFSPKVVYDGRRIIFSVRELPLGSTDSKKVISLV